MRVLVVFCEGPHDIHFAARSLTRHGGYQAYRGAASGLPTPFGWVPEDKLDKQVGLVLSQLRRLDPLEIDLDRVNFGQKPLFEYAAHCADLSTWALFVNMGGDSASAEVVRLLTEIRAGRTKRGIATRQVAYAFLFDADFLTGGRGLAWRVERFKKDYGTEFDLPELVSPGVWMTTARAPVGLWVHHAEGSEEGTLEDRAGPIFATHPDWAKPIAAAHTYIDEQGADGAPARGRRDKRWKATITIAGQVRPNADGTGALAGSGMNVMVQRGLNDAAFDAAVCRRLSDFLTAVPW